MLPTHRRLILTSRFERLLLTTGLAGAAAWAAWDLVLRTGLVNSFSLLGGAIVPLTLAAGIAGAWRGEMSSRRPAAAAGLACLPLAVWFAQYPAFAIVGSGAVVSLCVPGQTSALGRVNAALALGIATFAGFYVAAAFAGTRTLGLLPPVLLPPVLGALFGFVAGFGHLATQARCERDAVELLFRAERKRGAIPPHAAQALHLYRRVCATLPGRAGDSDWGEIRATVSRLVLQVLGLSRQAQEIAEDIALSDVDDLTRRRQAMQDAAAGAADPEAQRHYADTAAVLAQRLHRLRQFGRRRERVEAICHHCLSVLENLRLALAQARLTGPDGGQDDAAEALARLNALQSELDCTAEALRELEPDFAAVQSPPPTQGPLAPEATI